jgi:hypothetical protein
MNSKIIQTTMKVGWGLLNFTRQVLAQKERAKALRVPLLNQ